MSEGIYANKPDGSRECVIYHNWYFLDIFFRFDSKLCNGSHNLMQSFEV